MLQKRLNVVRTVDSVRIVMLFEASEVRVSIVAVGRGKRPIRKTMPTNGNVKVATTKGSIEGGEAESMAIICVY